MWCNSLLDTMKKNTIYPERESKDLELKERIPQKGQLLKTCVAFANGNGGEIVIGVEDKTNLVVGISLEERDRLFDEFSNAIYDAISPPIIPEIYEKVINDCSLVIIKIYPSTRAPHFIKSEGGRKGVYVRIGAKTRAASEEYLEDLYRCQKNKNYDEELTTVKMEELSSELIQKTYGKSFTTDHFQVDRVVGLDPMRQKDFLATVTGVLFFHPMPDTFIPECNIICTHFKGNSGREIIQTREIQGPIPYLIESSLLLVSSWIERNLKLNNKGQLKGKLLIPGDALREGITNALVHRKYFIPAPVKVALYDDHLEIFSPGNFPGMINPKIVGSGISFLRNPNIAKLARKNGLIEKLGSGVRLIFDLCKKEKLKKPDFFEDGDFVKLVFYFKKEKIKKVSIEEEIISLKKKYKKLSITDLTDHFSISRNTATRYVNKLIKKGLLKRNGQGPNVFFQFSSPKKN